MPFGTLNYFNGRFFICAFYCFIYMSRTFLTFVFDVKIFK